MKYYVCPMCMKTFISPGKKKNKIMVHCDIKIVEISKTEYKRIKK